MDIHPLRPQEGAEFLRIYEDSFPADERRAYASAADLFSFIVEKRREGCDFNILALTENAGPQSPLLGFITFWRFPGFAYVEHLAIDASLRGGGYGSALLSHLMDKISENVLLEVELPDSEEARRRIGWYRRNGFRLHDDIPYQQPPYEKGKSPVRMHLMTAGVVPVEDPREIEAFQRVVYGGQKS